MRATTVRPQAGSYTVGYWCWDTRHGSPCRVVDRQDICGVIAYRVWLPANDALVRGGAADFVPLAAVRPSLKQIRYTVAAGTILDAGEEKLRLAPLQVSVVPVAHPLYALNLASTP